MRLAVFMDAWELIPVSTNNLLFTFKIFLARIPLQYSRNISYTRANFRTIG